METSTRPTFLNFKSKWFNYRAKVNENFARDIAPILTGAYMVSRIGKD